MDDFQGTQMDNSQFPRRTYLITQSQADPSKFPSQQEFGKCIKTHFSKGSEKVKVQNWACSLEKHQSVYYHVAMKLTGSKRWKSANESITSSEGTVINMITTTLLINASPRKMHHSTTIHITLIWKIYPPHQPKSHAKLTGTLENPSPLTPLQLQKHLPKSCQVQKVNPSTSPDQKSANLW